MSDSNKDNAKQRKVLVDLNLREENVISGDICQITAELIQFFYSMDKQWKSLEES